MRADSSVSQAPSAHKQEHASTSSSARLGGEDLLQVTLGLSPPRELGRGAPVRPAALGLGAACGGQWGWGGARVCVSSRADARLAGTR